MAILTGMKRYLVVDLICIAGEKLLYNTGNSAWCSAVTLRGGEEVREGGDKCTFIADSHCCIAETNRTLSSSYPPIKHKI